MSETDPLTTVAIVGALVAKLDEILVELRKQNEERDKRDGPLFFSVAEAAELLGVSKWAIYDAIKRGDLPARTLGHRTIIPKVQLDAWLATKGAA